MTVKTRFAPSPTGYLHLGGARTAIFSWIFAHKMKGKFYLRIEDTDRERSTDAAIAAIFEGMRWLGLDWEGEAIYQTKRFDRYQQIIEQLLQEGKAYRCYCSKERLEKLRTQQLQQKSKPRYDGQCRDKTSRSDAEHTPYVVRFKNPLTGEVIIDDQVYGRVVVQNQELDDLIIARSDGVPTYNFCVVVDDWDMQITHVIRGDDHLNNTPRQINIFKALNANIPVYAHVPMILGPDGKKLSKRLGAMGVMEYRDQGFVPEAMLNYLVRLGWSYGDQEIFSRDELIKLFDIAALNKSAAALNPDKLLWLNQHYIKSLPTDTVAEYLLWHMQQQNIDINAGPPLIEVVIALRERAKTLKEMAEQSRYFYEEMTNYKEQAANQHLTKDAAPLLQATLTALESLSEWNKENIHQAIQQVVTTHQVKMPNVAQPIRVAVTGDTISPSIDVTLNLLGRVKTIASLERAVEYIQRSTSPK